LLHQLLVDKSLCQISAQDRCKRNPCC
jgi:hypothetical protein